MNGKRNEWLLVNLRNNAIDGHYLSLKAARAAAAYEKHHSGETWVVVKIIDNPSGSRIRERLVSRHDKGEAA